MLMLLHLTGITANCLPGSMTHALAVLSVYLIRLGYIQLLSLEWGKIMVWVKVAIAPATYTILLAA